MHSSKKLDQNWYWNDSEFQQFVELYPALEKLSIRNNANLKFFSSIRTIGQNLSNLVELEFYKPISNTDYEDGDQDFREFRECIGTFGELRSLKKLTMNLGCFFVPPLVEIMAKHNLPIEHLSIFGGLFDNDCVEYLTKLKTIKYLKMYQPIYNLTNENIVELAMEWPQFESFDFEGRADSITIAGLKKMLARLRFGAGSISIDVNDYMEMVKMVFQIQPNPIQLKIDLGHYWKSIVNVPVAILLENHQWISFEKF